MYKPISVCLPVYNEERAIGNTIDSILAQDFKGEMEILVCANGCTDKTEEIVRGYAGRHNNITLISTSQKGKPNAWNILQARASHNYRVYGDGDVFIDKEAFSNIYDALESYNVCAVGARVLPLYENLDFLTKLFTVRGGLQQCLVGRLYGFDNQKLTERMELSGFQKMPEHVVHEDLWLSQAIGNSQWIIANDAKVYFTPYSWREYYKMAKRHFRAEKQIEESYPELYEEYIKGPRLSLCKARANKIQECKSIMELILLFAGFPVRKAMMYAAKKSAKKETFANPLDAWEISEYSKVLLVPDKLD
jgi:glycosyltransferase involved in cell wall biosynthesis